MINLIKIIYPNLPTYSLLNSILLSLIDNGWIFEIGKLNYFAFNKYLIGDG